MADGYWKPWLGSDFRVAVGDIGRLTPQQLDACHDVIDRRR